MSRGRTRDGGSGSPSRLDVTDEYAVLGWGWVRSGGQEYCNGWRVRVGGIGLNLEVG